MVPTSTKVRIFSSSNLVRPKHLVTISHGFMVGTGHGFTVTNDHEFAVAIAGDFTVVLKIHMKPHFLRIVWYNKDFKPTFT